MKTTHISFNTYASEEHLKRVINAKSDLLRFACYITHDKDLWSEADEKKNPTHKSGTPKTAHRHLVVWLKSMREPKDICSWFKKCLDDDGELATTLWEETRHADKMTDYLTHKTEEAIDQGKYQYNDQDIKVLYGDIHEYVDSVTPFEERNRKADELKEKEATKREAQEESIDNMINDIIEGKPLRYMAKQYGRDYIKNRKAYTEFSADVLAQEHPDRMEEACELVRMVGGDVINRYGRQNYDLGSQNTISTVKALLSYAFSGSDIKKMNDAQRDAFELIMTQL